MGFSRGEYWSGLPFPFSGESSQPRDQTCVSYVYLHEQVDSLPLATPGKPQFYVYFTTLFFFQAEEINMQFKQNIWS